MIESMGKELIHGQIKENILESGKMIKGTEKANILLMRNKLKKESGSKILELNGFKMTINEIQRLMLHYNNSFLYKILIFI